MEIRPRPLDLCVWFCPSCFLLRSHIRCDLASVYTLPFSVIRATTGQLPGLNVITELIVGYVLPGHPIAMILFKTWGYITMIQAITFMVDLSLLTLRRLHIARCSSVRLSPPLSLVQLGVQEWMFSNVEGLCDADQKNDFICPHTIAFGNASIIVSELVVLALYLLCSVAQRSCVAVRCHWATAPIFARSALLWPRDRKSVV